jgi:hypothetical protein
MKPYDAQERLHVYFSRYCNTVAGLTVTGWGLTARFCPLLMESKLSLGISIILHDFVFNWTRE